MTDAGASQIIEAELTWTGAQFERGVQVEVDTKGRIAGVHRGGKETPTLRLRDRALMPGMINAHSHAFQRGLRGRGETFREGVGSFWSWREAMYELVGRMDAELIYGLSFQAFAEMLDAGITTVGEFHYLHHDASECGFAFDEIVLRAARDAGIRIVLLNVCYETGGIEQELSGGQSRFRCRAADEFWPQFDRLAKLIDPITQSLGVVAHSIRAVPLDSLIALHSESQLRGVPFHMHVEEQPREIEECLKHYHHTPMRLLTERLEISPRFTAVHCTHTAAADMSAFLEAGGNVCLCPLTEANLADGIPDAARIRKHNGRVCLGTDSNARISMIEEMRWLEYGQRLRSVTRGVWRNDAGAIGSALLRAATVDGAHALGLKAGVIEKGAHADFVTIDLAAPSLSGWTDESLLDAIIFGTDDQVIDDVCVGCKWRKQTPTHGERTP